ncbi:MAG: hypothetical protein BGN88_14020 [Clostridiales bacterium 43-6]|nr:MAG: hypothetical protein BGN88_14020 [Clostridiales bacterium 43-6]
MNVINCYPGTVVERRDRTTRDFLFGVFSVTKGLMLAQVKEITGLETPAVQNWINRGWVPKPVEKRYTVNHLARIILFNMLRDVMRFENIAALMTYINGSTEDRSDDIISDCELYIYICDILDEADYETILDDRQLNNVIEKNIVEYKEPYDGAKKKLIMGLRIILIYYASAIIKVKADRLYINEIEDKGVNTI